MFIQENDGYFHPALMCQWLISCKDVYDAIFHFSEVRCCMHLDISIVGCGSIRMSHVLLMFNTLRPRQNGRHFADNTFKRIFVNENARIAIKISLRFVAKGPINNIPALVQIMAWRRPGDKPLSEPMLVFVPTHLCVNQPHWVNWLVLLGIL